MCKMVNSGIDFNNKITGMPKIITTRQELTFFYRLQKFIYGLKEKNKFIEKLIFLLLSITKDYDVFFCLLYLKVTKKKISRIKMAKRLIEKNKLNKNIRIL